jgi:hypothetical protein
MLTDRCAYLLGLLLMLQLPWDVRSSRLAATGLALLSGLLAVVALAWWALGPGRPAWPFLSPNRLAAYLAFGTVLALAVSSLWNRWGMRWGLRAAALLCGLAVLATTSRGGVLALAAGLAIWAALSGRLRLRLLIPAAALLAVAMGTVYLVRVTWGGDPYQHDRLRIWRAAAAVWADHPLTGVGPGQLHYRSGPYQFPQDLSDSVARYSRRWRQAHSAYLQVLAEEGTLGALAFGAALALFLAGLIRPGPGPRGLPLVVSLAPLAALLAQGLVDDLPQSPALVWPPLVLFAATVVPARPARKEVRWPRMPVTAAMAAGVAILYAAWGVVLAPYLAERAALGAAAARGEERIAGLERASRLNPLHAGTPVQLGRTLAPEDRPLGPARFVRAARVLEPAARLSPLDPEVRVAAGRIQMRGHLEVAADRGTAWRAKVHYGEAALEDRCDALTLLEAARAYAVLGSTDIAEIYVVTALDAEPRFLAAHLEYVRLLGAAGDLDRARRAMRDLGWAREEISQKRASTKREKILVRLDEAELQRLERLLSEAGAEEGPRE